MIKMLLSITIWLRKYQGRRGNYYTICNAATLLAINFMCFLLLLNEILIKNSGWQNAKAIIGGTIIFSILFLTILFTYLLMDKLRSKKLHLAYKDYRRNMNSFTFMIVALIIILIVKSVVRF